MKGPWEITADRITRQSNPQRIVGEGNVVLERVEQEGISGMLLKADWVEYNIDDGIVHAKGNLSLHSELHQKFSGYRPQRLNSTRHQPSQSIPSRHAG